MSLRCFRRVIMASHGPAQSTGPLRKVWYRVTADEVSRVRHARGNTTSTSAFIVSTKNRVVGKCADAGPPSWQKRSPVVQPTLGIRATPFPA